MNTGNIRTGIVLSLALVAVTLSLTWAGKAGLINADLPLRITMALSCMLIAYYGNAIPKALMRSEGAISARRFAGWAFVLCGIATTAVWMVAPLDFAAGTTLVVVGATALLVLSICTLTRRKPSAGH